MRSMLRQFKYRPQREVAIGMAAFSAISLILFIAGAIMLGVGISKANQADELSSSCPPNPSSTDTSTTSTTLPPPVCSCPTVKPPEQLVPVPYFVSLQTNAISPDDLTSNYSQAVTKLQKEVQSSLPDAAGVTVLSASPSADQQSGAKSAAAIVAIIYSSGVDNNASHIWTSLQQDSKMNVSYIQDSSLPTNLTVANQMCIEINTDPERVTPPPPPPIQKIYPCSTFVTFVMDLSNTTNYRRRFDFLKNTVLTQKWNHFERVGYGVFSRFADFKSYGNFKDYDDLKLRLEWDAQFPKNKSSSLNVAFKSINQFYYPNKTLNSAVILFLTQASEEEVRSVQHINLLPRLTIVTVGPTTGDSARINLTALQQLNIPIIQWEDPSQDIPDWEILFWKAYTCEGQPAPQTFHWSPDQMTAEVSVGQPEVLQHHHLLRAMNYGEQPRRWSDFSGVLLLSSRAESVNVSFTPCEKQIVIIYDCSNGISGAEFRKQLDFLSNKLLATNWNHFERLGLGFYGSAALLNPFKLMSKVDQAKKYIQFTYQSRKKTSINTLLRALAMEDVYRQNKSLDVSTIIFVSNTSSEDIAAAQQYASTINSFGRLTVVILKPSLLSDSAIAPLTPNIIEWDISSKEEPDNWKQLFQTAYGCDAVVPIEDAFLPCPISKRQIVVAIDASNNLTAAHFQIEKNFLINQLFAPNSWNHFERLGISNYAKFVSSRSFGMLHSSTDIKNAISYIVQQRKSPSLSALLRDLNEKYPNNSTQPNAYIVFTSRANPNDVTQAINDSVVLASRGRLTFVALNSVAVDQLKRLSDNIIPWNMTSTSSPLDWPSAFLQAYNCADTLKI